MKRVLIFVIILFSAALLSAQNTGGSLWNDYTRLRLKLEQGDTTGLRIMQRRLSGAGGSPVLALALEGHLANALGEYELAQKQFTYALDEADTLADALSGRALAAGRSGLFGKARADLTRLIELKGPDAYVLKLRGLAALEMVDYDAASEDFSRALKLEPADNELLYLSALVNYKTDHFRQAFDRINQALAADSTNAQYYYLRGSIKMGLKKNDEALADFNYALQLRPGFADALTMKGYLFYLTGDTQQALTTLKLATEADPSFSLPWFYCGLCQVELELPADALRSFDHAATLGYDDGDMYHYRGLAYVQLRRFDDACQAWKDAVLRGYRLSKALSRRYCQ